MDIATIVGLVVAIVLILISIVADGQGVNFFFNVPSALIVFGGAFGATLVAFPLSDVIAVAKVAKNAILHKADSPMETIETMVRVAEKARREGILAIEREIEDINEPFMRIGVQYAVDGTEPETIRAILESELSGMEERHKSGKMVFEVLGTYAPAFGMIGTLIGLIKMLASLEDPTQIGAGMAVALVTTLYGSMAANIAFLPLAAKLDYRSKQEVRRKELIIEGILAIQSGDNPRIVREKLMTYLPPAEREGGEEARF
ncbi:motility protein A [bacterium]|nr:motility protein A [bacterium]